MKRSAVYAVSAAFALALTAVLADQTHAGSAVAGHIIEHEYVDCLDVNWNKRTNWLSHDKPWVQNESSEFGTVVAEVDTERSCMAQFRASSASDTCENVTADFIKPDRCFISAVCKSSDSGYISTSIEVSRSDAAKLTNCNGILEVEGC